MKEHHCNSPLLPTFPTQLPDPAILPPSLAAKTARVVLSQDSISWKDVLFHWLHSSVPDYKTNIWETIKALFCNYLPPTLEFISPALLQDFHQAVTSVSTTSVGSNAAGTTLKPQELRVTPVQVVSSCCRILQVRHCKWFVWGFQCYLCWYCTYQLTVPFQIFHFACHNDVAWHLR